MGKLARNVKIGDGLLYKDRKWVVMARANEAPKLGAPVVRLTLKDQKTKETDVFTFATDQSMFVI